MNRSIRLSTRDRRWGRIKGSLKRAASRLARRCRKMQRLERERD